MIVLGQHAAVFADGAGSVHRETVGKDRNGEFFNVVRCDEVTAGGEGDDRG